MTLRFQAVATFPMESHLLHQRIVQLQIEQVINPTRATKMYLKRFVLHSLPPRAKEQPAIPAVNPAVPSMLLVVEFQGETVPSLVTASALGLKLNSPIASRRMRFIAAVAVMALTPRLVIAIVQAAFLVMP
jgi:hypothetical protein